MKYFITLVFVILVINATAQKDEEGSVTDIIKITLLNPGFSYEKALGQFQTLYVQAFMNTSATRSESFYATEIKYYFDPAFTAQFRFYYNYNRRKERRLRTELNNLNYITPLYQVFFSKAPIENISV
jgi:hypothetical protein